CYVVSLHTLQINRLSCVLILILTCLWALILISSSFALKPAKLPLIGRKPFIAAWNAPFDLCTTKYNISVNLEMFHISGSPRASRRGQNVTIFYANRLGHYPFYTEEGLPVNGGLPQNCSLETHLQKADKDIKFYIPSENFSGLAIIDWEYWRPQWLRNWQKKDIYRRKSRDLISKGYINVTSQQIEYLAQARFERSAMAFMKRTIQLGIQTRPHGLWGYYLYPDCHNYNLLDNNYTGSCPVLESLRNDELFWLWNSSTALFPSIAIKKSHADSVSNLYFAQFRVLESLRIASMTSMDYDLPTFVYTRLGYRDEALSFLSTKDLIHTIGESAALGAAGFVIWGDVNLTSSRASCEALSRYLPSTLNPYIVNVTAAAKLCSDMLCQGNGRCVRKNYDSNDYLHLNPANFKIQRGSNGKYFAVGMTSSADLTIFMNKFTCRCYAVRTFHHC
uniref:Hyaluronidase n=1 Tax=Lepisosteus oculatus TaxID=7918 RepID=W5NFW7_LEPOC